MSKLRFQKTEFCELIDFLEINCISFTPLKNIYLFGFNSFNIAPTSAIEIA